MAKSDLFKDFAPTSKEEWLAKIEKDLKGKSLESLSRSTHDDITIKPVYFADETEVKNQPLKEHPKWDPVQEILVEDTKEANLLALEHLNRGATSLLFYLMGNEELEVLLKDIEIQYICLNLVVGENATEIANQLNALIKKRGLEEVEIAGSVNFDPLENLARTGNWFSSEQADFEELKKLNQSLQSEIRGLCVNGNLFCNGGASHAQQLGIALAMSYEYIHQLGLKNTNPFWINLAVGSDYFAEIAKLRAFRRLWRQLQNELGFPEKEVRLYVETALRNKTIFDRHNNMIRTTTEAMAAVIGGASEVSVKGFNHTFTDPDFFGERIAKNQQNILQHESHFQQVRDMARGSYFIEQLTEELAGMGWGFFKEIEAQGGYLACLKSGWLQDVIEKSAQKEQQDFDRGEKVLIGANKHRPENEDLKDFAKAPLFYRSPGRNTAVRPVATPRLAESIEKQALEQK